MSEENLNDLVNEDEDQNKEVAVKEISQNTVVTLASENFSKFYTILSIISKDCTDLTIENGIICQMTDRRSAIYYLDLTSLIGTTNLMISNLPSKCEMLDPFKKQGVEFSLVINKNEGKTGVYQFTDGITEINIVNPIKKFISNEFIDVETFEERLSLSDEAPIFQIVLQPFLVNRIASISKGMASSIVRLDFLKNKVNFMLTPGDNNSKLTAKIVGFDISEDTEFVCGFPINPFLISSGDLNIECFKRNDGENILLKISSEIEEIPIEVWCMSRITKLDEVI